MGMTFHRTFECSECGFVFKGLRGMQGNDLASMHHISPMICTKCGNMRNVVTGYDIDDKVSICENCGIEMEHMDEDAVYECPECHKKSLKCVNTDSVYSSGTIYLY